MSRKPVIFIIAENVPAPVAPFSTFTPARSCICRLKSLNDYYLSSRYKGPHPAFETRRFLVPSGFFRFRSLLASSFFILCISAVRERFQGDRQGTQLSANRLARQCACGLCSQERFSRIEPHARRSRRRRVVASQGRSMRVPSRLDTLKRFPVENGKI